MGSLAAGACVPEPLGAQAPRDESGETELELFERFARALLHAVRGDLSVIQNELSFVSALYGEENVRSSIARCHSIAAVLSHLSHARVPAALEAIPIADVVLGASAAGSLQGERESLAFALGALPELLRARVGVTEASSCAVRIEITHLPSVTGSFRSLSSFISAELGEAGVVRAVVADLVLRHLGYAAHVEASASGVAVLLTGVGPLRNGREAA